jgi:hypothetical protein
MAKSGTSGEIGKVDFDIRHNGVRFGAVGISDVFDGPFTFHSPHFLNMVSDPATPGAFQGAFSVKTPVKITGTPRFTLATTAPVGSRTVMPSAPLDATVDIIGEVAIVDMGDVAAGTPRSGLWVAPVDCWIRAWEVMVGGFGVTQNDTNYVTVTLRNMSVADITSFTTKTTPSGGTALAQDTLVRIQNTTQFSSAQSYVAKGTVVRIRATHTGTGAAIPQLTNRIHYVPYGAA